MLTKLKTQASGFWQIADSILDFRRICVQGLAKYSYWKVLPRRPGILLPSVVRLQTLNAAKWCFRVIFGLPSMIPGGQLALYV